MDSTLNNLHSVTSNAVASMFNVNLNDNSLVNITNAVSVSLGLSSVYARRKDNLVYLEMNGTYTGVATIETQQLLRSLPSKYIPSHDVTGAFLGYNPTQIIAVARGTIKTDGEILLSEANWVNGTIIRIGITYCVD